jgi:hypothetical protein
MTWARRLTGIAALCGLLIASTARAESETVPTPYTTGPNTTTCLHTRCDNIATSSPTGAFDVRARAIGSSPECPFPDGPCTLDPPGASSTAVITVSHVLPRDVPEITYTVTMSGFELLAAGGFYRTGDPLSVMPAGSYTLQVVIDTWFRSPSSCTITGYGYLSEGLKVVPRGPLTFQVKERGCFGSDWPAGTMQLVLRVRAVAMIPEGTTGINTAAVKATGTSVRVSY